ncbi:hypothetical protein ACL02O_31415 [Micromonospora sp. MS34]|uniref:hypothetical protein n=1 Tax=Micromonospora sp. MS34 TaxID=3385971 RepID=UPI00399FD05B
MRRLSPRQLENLVAEHALRDRLFATQLLAGAGLRDANHITLTEPRPRFGPHAVQAAGVA